MKLLKRKFYKYAKPKDIEVEELSKADYMIVEQLMTKVEAEEKWPFIGLIINKLN